MNLDLAVPNANLDLAVRDTRDLFKAKRLPLERAVNLTRAALKLGADVNWLAAKQTFDQCGPSGKGGRTLEKQRQYITLSQWSELVSDPPGNPFSPTKAGYYRQIWETYSEEYLRGGIPWSEAYDAIRGQTPNQRMAEFNLTRGWENATPEVKREAFREFAADESVQEVIPTVVREAVSTDAPVAGEVARAAFEAASPQAMDYAYRNNASRKAFNEAGMRWHEENLKKQEERTQADPFLKKLDETRAALDLQEWVDDVRKDMQRHIDVLFNKILPRLGSLPEAQRDPMAMRMMLVSAMTDLENALEPIRNLINTGQYDLDSFVKEVLGGKPRG